MKNNVIIIFSILISIILLFSCGGPAPVATDSSFDTININQDPIQVNLSGDDVIKVEKDDLKLDITLKAEYHIEAMVMSKKKYTDGWTSKISTYDLALAWGDLTDPDVYEHIDFSQNGRWFYFYNNAGSPVTVDYIYLHAANSHIIHASENIKHAIRKKVRKHSLVVIDGYLVWVDGTQKGRDIWWHSSLTREDRGDGSCEVIYVTKIRIGDEVFE